MMLVVRSPKDRPIKWATVNGKLAQVKDETITLPREKGPFRVTARR
jgi:hypothetical protein